MKIEKPLDLILESAKNDSKKMLLMKYEGENPCLILDTVKDTDEIFNLINNENYDGYML